MELSEGLKKIFLAGVGAVATTTEAAKDVVDTLVTKGELTVAQGKVLNEELKHNAKEKLKEHVTVTVTRNYSDAMNSVDHMTDDELNALKEKIAAVEKEKAEKASASADDAAADDAAANTAADVPADNAAANAAADVPADDAAAETTDAPADNAAADNAADTPADDAAEDIEAAPSEDAHE